MAHGLDTAQGSTVSGRESMQPAIASRSGLRPDAGTLASGAGGLRTYQITPEHDHGPGATRASIPTCCTAQTVRTWGWCESRRQASRLAVPRTCSAPQPSGPSFAADRLSQHRALSMLVWAGQTGVCHGACADAVRCISGHRSMPGLGPAVKSARRPQKPVIALYAVSLNRQ